MKLANMKITPKLGILVGVALLGLCAAGVLAGRLMQREMLNARIDQVKAIVDMGLNLAAGLKKQVDAGQMTKEAALAELSRRANSMTYDKGAGYLFGTTNDGITVMAPDPKQIGTDRMDVVTNGRKLSRELMDGVKANGSILLTYEYMKPGEETPIRKMSYAVAVPGFDMYLGTGAYLDDLDAKMKPIAWVLGLAILGIAVISGSIAWLIGRSISKPLGELGARMQALADGQLDGEIPGLDRGDEVGAMAKTVQIFKDNAHPYPRPRTGRSRDPGARRGRAPRRDGEHRQRFRAQRHRHRPFGLDRGGRHADHRAIDDRDRERRQRACRHCRRGLQNASNNVGTVAAAAEELSSSVAEISRQVARSSEVASKAVRRCRAHQCHRAGALHRRREDRRGREADPLDRGANQPAGAERHHRGGARRRIRPRLRGCRFRGEGARQPDGASDRRNLGAGRRDAGFHR